MSRSVVTLSGLRRTWRSISAVYWPASYVDLILNTTFRKPEQMVQRSVHVMGFAGPFGAFLAARGGIAMLTSAPFDNWWRNAYGLDVRIISPPHTLLMLGSLAVQLGALFLILAAMNRTAPQEQTWRSLRRLDANVAQAAR